MAPCAQDGGNQGAIGVSFIPKLDTAGSVARVAVTAGRGGSAGVMPLPRLSQVLPRESLLRRRHEDCDRQHNPTYSGV